MGNQAMLVGVALEAVAKIRVRNCYQCHGAFRHGLSLEICHAVFSHNVHDVGARRGDDVARRQLEHDAAAAFAPFVVGG